MRKKLFALAWGFIFIVTSVICLTACNKYAGVDLFGKTYTFKTEAIYSLTDEEGNELDMENWFAKNFDKIKNEQEFSDLSAQEIVSYLKSSEYEKYLLTRKAYLLKGATITISDGTITGNGKDKKGIITLIMGDIEISTEIKAHNSSNKYEKYDHGKIFNGSDYNINPHRGFRLTNYSIEDGTIRDVEVELLQVFDFANWDIEWYTNAYEKEFTIDRKTVIFKINYPLESVN